ncbi:MAG: DUF4892 domain-containing protein [Pseudomonadales bacterium]|jgi:hypothetical protein|nr:DUF4892 domain-containing protein [Pseudomonadales bacterium]
MTSLLLAALAGLLAASPARAQQDQAGTADPAGLERYPRAWIVAASEDDRMREVDVPIARIARSEDVAQGRGMRRVRGTRRTLTWAHPRGVDPAAVFAHLRGQLPQEALFECQGRDCGISAIWAHDVFGVPDLYGRDGQQHYVALVRPTPEGPVTLMLYVSERGTREVFAHLVEVRGADQQAAPGEVAGLAGVLRDVGHGRIAGIAFTADDRIAAGSEAALAALVTGLAEILAEGPADRDLWIVAHGRAASPEAALASTRRRAEAVVEALSPELAGARLRALGVGPAVPRILGDADFVLEVVLP